MSADVVFGLFPFCEQQVALTSPTSRAPDNSLFSLSLPAAFLTLKVKKTLLEVGEVVARAPLASAAGVIMFKRWGSWPPSAGSKIF